MILENVAKRAGSQSVGVWLDQQGPDCLTQEAVTYAVANFRQPAYLVQAQADPGFESPNGMPCSGALPALYPEWLGGHSFTDCHALRYPYVAGAMARGIASTALVIAMGKAGMLGFFGSAGLPLTRIESALDEIEAELGNAYSWGCNLINSITNPEWEEALVDLLLRRKVQRVSASAYMELTPALVRYAFCGVYTDSEGLIVRPNYVFAKISRPDVARHFMSPPPEAMLQSLLASGQLSSTEVELAKQLPVAEDYIVESDSGGHTDNQPLPALFPCILELRYQKMREFGYSRPIRLGAAGGLGTPASLAAAFAMGAEFVVTGSVNQASVEAGVSHEVKQMLALSEMADFTMCPCADMFELGVKVQVLKRSSMFAVRASQLYAIYCQYKSIDHLPESVRIRIEKQIFQQPLADIWQVTSSFFQERNPTELARAEAEPKHKMALIFRWYMGNSSQWPIRGESSRVLDYQIWSGPAMGAFNAWVAGSFLEPLEHRHAAQIALNLLEGAAAVTRAQQLRLHGIPVPFEALSFSPRPLA